MCGQSGRGWLLFNFFLRMSVGGEEAAVTCRDPVSDGLGGNRSDLALAV